MLLILISWNFTAVKPYIESALKQAALPDKELEEGMVDLSRTGGTKSLVTFDVGYIVESNLLSAISGSDSHIKITVVRVAYTSLYIVLGIVSALVVLRRDRSRKNVMLFLMVCSFVCLLPIRAAGWELGQRLFIFALPFMAYFVVESLKIALPLMYIFIIIILISSPLWFISHYGNQVVDYMSPEYIDGITKVQEIKDTALWNKFMQWGKIGWLDDELVFREYATWGIHNIAISKHDDDIFTFSYGEPDYIDNIWGWLEEGYHPELFCEYELIYSNPEFSIYNGYRALTEDVWDKYGDGKWKEHR